MKQPLFILGCERSGTTLLASLLQCSSYGELVETHFITKYYKHLDNYGNLRDKNNLTKLLKDILKTRSVMQWKIRIDLDRFYEELEEFSYREIVHNLCMKMARKNGNRLWGDKTPHFTLDVDILYEIFPNSKYIFIVRDGRDVALSLLNEPWGEHNIFTCAERWNKYNRSNQILEQLNNQKQLFFLRYEDLLDNAEKILRDLYKFIDEEFHEKEMNKLIKGIRKGNYNKWKSTMSERQIKVFENTAADTLKRFGYETTYDETGINGFMKAAYHVHESIMKVNFLFRTNVIDGIKIRYFGKEPFAD
ncbi:MAG: sulfotransferase [Nitrospirae bacterium]|nr:sulfotransferase [Nitrospirota bacterium]